MSTTAPITQAGYASRPCFAPAFGGGASVPMRSTLEARWAVCFNAFGLPWEYEPETFALDTGRLYTPDFRVESELGPALIEIKPTPDTLKDAAHKLDALRRGLAAMTPAPALFTFTAPAPTFAGDPPPVLQWRPGDADGEVRLVPAQRAVRLFAGPAGRALLAESRDGYWHHVNRTFATSGREIARRSAPMREVLFLSDIAKGMPFTEARARYYAHL